MDIHTRHWKPPPDPSLRTEIADRCVGYCGADIKALCTGIFIFSSFFLFFSIGFFYWIFIRFFLFFFYFFFLFFVKIL